MAFVIKNRSTVLLKEETTEGVYAAPTSGADAVEVLDNFSGFDYSRENIERKILTPTVEAIEPRAGIPTVAGALETELKAAATEGSAPRADVLLKSLLGGKRSASAMAVGATSSTTVIKLSDADALKVKAGDCLLFKIPGAHVVRPVLSVVTTSGAGAATLAVPLPSTPSTGVVIAPVTTYYHDTNDVSFSVSAELGEEITEKALGCKVESGDISNWTTGKIPQIAFKMKALGLDKADSVSGLTPDFSSEPTPPVALDAHAFLGTEALEYNDFSLTMNNTLVDLLSAAQPKGKIASRLTHFLTTGTINPYMKSDAVDRFTQFNTSGHCSLFVYTANPSSVAGELSNVTAIYMPRVLFTAVKNGDQSGVLTDEISFQATKTLGKDTVFLSFI